LDDRSKRAPASYTSPSGDLLATRRRFLHWAIIIGLLLLFFAQLAFGARHLSLTTDEPAHIVRGYVALSSGDFWMVPLQGHPPLIEEWAALPLILRSDRPDPSTVSHWQENAALYVQALMPELGTVVQLEVVTRVPVMLLSVVLLALVYRWAGEIGGRWAGACAAFLMALDSTMIAHSQLDTTDLGITLLIFAFLYLFSRLAKRPSVIRILAVGLVAGGAMAAKHSGIIVLPLSCALAAWAWLWLDSGFRCRSLSVGLRTLDLSRSLVWMGRAAAIIVVAVLALWAIYGFEVESRSSFPWIVPFPSHIRSLGVLFENQSRLSFLRGNLREGGWWYYFPVVFLIKTPLPFLAALLLSVCDELRRGWRAWLADLPIWILPVAYWITVMGSEMQIGYRHLLPLLPFMYVAAGRAILRSGSLRKRVGRWIAVGGALWYALGTLSIYPYSIAYFNELVGGPSNGYRYVVDSNVDWGHSFKALAEYMREEGIGDVNLSYYTWVDPSLYGVRYEALPPAPDTEDVNFPYLAPSPGVYAISATTLQGILLRNPDLYEWFRHQTPVSQPGYGINVYRVPSPEVALTWVAQCTVPVAPLSLDAIKQGFGGVVQRVAYFDCTQAWLFPGGSQTAGWFVLHMDALGDDDAWTTSRLSAARLSYRQRQPRSLPPFSVYEWQPSSVPAMDKVVQVSKDSVAVNDSFELSSPVSFDGPLALLGYQVVMLGEQDLELYTWWNVIESPERPFSLMGHVIDEDGQAVLVADGLGIPFTELQVGDQFVQRHRFQFHESGAAAESPLWLQTGGYWLDTMERWPVMTEDGIAGDRVILAEIDHSGS